MIEFHLGTGAQLSWNSHCRWCFLPSCSRTTATYTGRGSHGLEFDLCCGEQSLPPVDVFTTQTNSKQVVKLSCVGLHMHRGYDAVLYATGNCKTMRLSFLAMDKSDFVLRNTILMVSSHSSKGQALAPCNAMCLPWIGRKHTIVSTTVL